MPDNKLRSESSLTALFVIHMCVCGDLTSICLLYLTLHTGTVIWLVPFDSNLTSKHPFSVMKSKCCFHTGPVDFLVILISYRNITLSLSHTHTQQAPPPHNETTKTPNLIPVPLFSHGRKFNVITSRFGWTFAGLLAADCAVLWGPSKQKASHGHGRQYPCIVYTHTESFSRNLPPVSPSPTTLSSHRIVEYTSVLSYIYDG